MVSVKQVVVIMRYLGLRAFRQKANALLAMCILVCSTIAAALGFFSNSVQMALVYGFNQLVSDEISLNR